MSELIDLLEISDFESISIGVRNSSGSSSEYNYRTDSLHANPSNIEYLNANLHHELNHFLMHVSTPYGQFLDTLVEAQNAYALTFCSSHLAINPDAKIVCPIFKIAKQYSGDYENFKTDFPGRPDNQFLWNNFVKPWSNMVFTEQVCEGHGFVNAPNRTRAVESLQVVENLFRESSYPFNGSGWGLSPTPNATFPNWSDADINIKLEASESCLRCCPEVDTDSGTADLGASHIYECLAILQEGEFAPLTINNLHVRNSHWSAYFMACAEYLTNGNQIDNPSDFEAFLTTTKALAQLALFTPIGNPYALLRAGKDRNWFDLHPGGRFFVLVSMLDFFGTIRNRDEIAEYQNKICDYLNWPRIEDFLDLAKSCESRTFIQKRHLAFMTDLRSDTTRYLYNEISPELLAAWGPLINVSGGMQGFLPRTNPEDLVSSVIYAVMSKGAWNIMMSNPEDISNYIPEINNLQDNIGEMLELALSELNPRNFSYVE